MVATHIRRQIKLSVQRNHSVNLTAGIGNAAGVFAFAGIGIKAEDGLAEFARAPDCPASRRDRHDCGSWRLRRDPPELQLAVLPQEKLLTQDADFAAGSGFQPVKSFWKTGNRCGAQRFRQIFAHRCTAVLQLTWVGGGGKHSAHLPERFGVKEFVLAVMPDRNKAFACRLNAVAGFSERMPAAGADAVKPRLVVIVSGADGNISGRGRKHVARILIFFFGPHVAKADQPTGCGVVLHQRAARISAGINAAVAALCEIPQIGFLFQPQRLQKAPFRHDKAVQAAQMIAGAHQQFAALLQPEQRPGAAVVGQLILLALQRFGIHNDQAAGSLGGIIAEHEFFAAVPRILRNQNPVQDAEIAARFALKIQFHGLFFFRCLEYPAQRVKKQISV